MSGRWALLVIWKDGTQEYMRQGPAGDEANSVVATFNRKTAEINAEFMLQGIEDEVQSVNVVPAPKVRA